MMITFSEKKNSTIATDKTITETKDDDDL